jgi:predicted restriction endonuclease
MRRALKARDDGCRFPGCTHRHFIDGHHIRHWADGGETSMRNLVLLCRFHHRLVHERGFGCERTDDGRIVFTNPAGTEIAHSCHLPAIPIDSDIFVYVKKTLDGVELDPQACVSKWEGEKIDWPLAVGHLYQ